MADTRNPPHRAVQKAKVLREKRIDTHVDLGGGNQQDQKTDLRKLSQDLIKAPKDRHSLPEKTLGFTTSYNKGEILREDHH